jgi:hypothetical protein
MRSFVFYQIEMEELNKTVLYFWNVLNDPLNGFRSKAFESFASRIRPASLGGSGKGVKCYTFIYSAYSVSLGKFDFINPRRKKGGGSYEEGIRGSVGSGGVLCRRRRSRQ